MVLSERRVELILWGPLTTAANFKEICPSQFVRYFAMDQLFGQEGGAKHFRALTAVTS